MDRLLERIYNLEDLDHSDIKAVKNKLTALNFILVEDDYRTVPRKILTTKGILELIGSYKEELNRCSELTEHYSYGRTNAFCWSFYMNKSCYELYKNAIVTYLLNNKSLLIKYLNAKYNINLTKDDISAEGIIKNSIKINRTKKIYTDRNKKIEKQNTYIRTKYGTFLLAKCNKIFLLKGDNNERRNIIKSEYRRNGSFYKNESNFTNAYIS